MAGITDASRKRMKIKLFFIIFLYCVYKNFLRLKDAYFLLMKPPFFVFSVLGELALELIIITRVMRMV